MCHLKKQKRSTDVNDFTKIFRYCKKVTVTTCKSSVTLWAEVLVLSMQFSSSSSYLLEKSADTVHLKHS